MELQVKSFKISTRKREGLPNKVPVLQPLRSKTPQKIGKNQAKSQTPNRTARKLLTVKTPNLNNIASFSHNFEKLETPINLPQITGTPLVTEENTNTERLHNEDDKEKAQVKVVRSEDQKILDSHKPMLSLYFRNKIRSLLYVIQRRELAQNNGHSVREDILFRLSRIVMTRSKFKYKDKIDFFKAAILKTINYDIRTRILMNHQKNNDSESSDHEHDHHTNDDRKSRGKALAKGPVPRNLSTPNSHLVFRDDSKKLANNANEKVYMVVGGYDDLKEALKNRGWIENTNPSSLRFDFKWTLKIKDIEYNKLKDHQIVNHFEKNSCLTSKVGVCRNLRNLIGSDSIDIDEFYPRCFDLEDANDFEDFIEDFKFSKAEAIVKEYVRMKGNNNPDKNRELAVRIAVAALARKFLDIYEKIHQIGMGVLPVIVQEEWAVLEDLNAKHYERNPDFWNKMLDKYNQFLNSLMPAPKEKDKTPRQINLMEQCEFVLKEAQRLNPQFFLNGYRNIWILKPALLSRGRGIKCFNNLGMILDFVINKKIPYVCQKYIENPLIIKSKKFDIRQWVLVTEWCPLTVWFYEICYIRFGADEYDPNDLSNRYSHLTNNSIAKYSNKFASSEIKGNMWTMEEFAQFIKSITNQDHFFQKIQPRMKKIVVDVLKSVEDMVQVRKKSMELYGFDFMIDENLVPWIIEINSSPAMDYSTPVTEKLVKMVMEDVVKVTVDLSQSKNKKNVNCGNFSCIYQGSMRS